MMESPQLSIIIPTHKQHLAVEELMHSILRQQSTPSYEVLVVSYLPDTKLERMLLTWDSRFRYVCSGTDGASQARNTGVREAKGEIVLFLEDDSRIDDPMFLKRHWEHHQRFTKAIAIGGRYSLSRKANIFECAFHWATDSQLSRARIDSVRTSFLSPGNASFKATALRPGFEFNEKIAEIGAAADLCARLAKTGCELHLNDRLTVERKWDIGLIGFIEKAFLRGRAEAIRKHDGLMPLWFYPGSRKTIIQNMNERGTTPTLALMFLLWLYACAFDAGLRQASLATTSRTTVPTRWQIVRGFWTELRHRWTELPYSRPVTELFHALRFSVFRR